MELDICSTVVSESGSQFVNEFSARWNLTFAAHSTSLLTLIIAKRVSAWRLGGHSAREFLFGKDPKRPSLPSKCSGSSWLLRDQTTIDATIDSTIDLTFPSIAKPILRNDLKKAFVPKHTNATYSQPANDSTTAPRSSGLPYGRNFVVLSLYDPEKLSQAGFRSEAYKCNIF